MQLGIFCVTAIKMKITSTNLIFSFTVAATILTVAECTKYTSRELEEIRKFYYDDLDYGGDQSISDENQSNYQRKNHDYSSARARKPEPRSSSKLPTTEEPTTTSRAFGPGQFFKDTRKILDTGRKTIDRAAERIFSLPRSRSTRTEKQSNLSMMKRSAKARSSAHSDEGLVQDDSDYEESHTDQEGHESTGQGKGSRIAHRGALFKNPFKDIQNDASRVAADTGGKILSILNKFTPPPILGLPTPLPNLEDFGG